MEQLHHAAERVHLLRRSRRDTRRARQPFPSNKQVFGEDYQSSGTKPKNVLSFAARNNFEAFWFRLLRG